MAVPAVIQKGDNQDFGASTLDVTFPDPQTEGNTNAVYTLNGSGANVTTVIDDAGNLYELVLSYHSTNPPGMDDGRFEIWAAPASIAAHAGGNVVHITWDGPANVQAFVAELEPSVPDVKNAASGPGQVLASAPFMTTAADELILAFFSASSTISVDPGYTEIARNAFFGSVLASTPAGVVGVYAVTAAAANLDTLWDLTFVTWAAPATSSSNGLWFGTDA
jgi:hypothetical protein